METTYLIWSTTMKCSQFPLWISQYGSLRRIESDENVVCLKDVVALSMENEAFFFNNLIWFMSLLGSMLEYVRRGNRKAYSAYPLLLLFSSPYRSPSIHITHCDSSLSAKFSDWKPASVGRWLEIHGIVVQRSCRFWEERKTCWDDRLT